MTITELSLGMSEEIKHYPVMYNEVMQFLNIKNCRVVVDCTAGIGSHGLKFLEAMREDAIFIGIDRDEDSLNICSERLKFFNGRVILVNDNFSNLDKILNSLNIAGADAIFFDLGISTYQLTSSERGFGFLKEGSLDMRMDRNSFVCAYDLVNNLSENELVNIFRKFGEERYAGRIAHAIVGNRRNQPISTTLHLAEIISRAVPAKSRRYRIHPATRVFQALRIVVNRELEALNKGVDVAIRFLNKGGRVGVISFHSLEDRIVKHTFRDFSHQGILQIITKKPLLPGEEEIEANNASRSAKFRVTEKVEDFHIIT